MTNLKPAELLPAKTGNDSNNNTAVITTAHPNNANFILHKNKCTEINT